MMMILSTLILLGITKKTMGILWPELSEYMPAFESLKIISGWARWYALNRFDGNVFLGEWPQLEGFMSVNGFSGHGFQQCPAVGRYPAEIIRDVEPFLDLSNFSPKSFLDNKLIYDGHGKLV